MNVTQRQLHTLLAAAVLALVAPLYALEMPKLEIELKGQVWAENTDFGAAQDRSGSRTDLHFQRLRLEVAGMVNETWGFRFQTDNSSGTSKNSLGYSVTAQDTDVNDRDIRLIDAYAVGNFSEALNLQLGLVKKPLTRANLDDCFAPLSFERSMWVQGAYGSSPIKFSRDVGGVLTGTFNDSKLRYWVGAFQGREGFTRTTHPFSGATVTSTMEPSDNLEFMGRIHYSLLGAETGSG
jgi:hypothetical protein